MADLPISSGTTSLGASGLNSILTYFHGSFNSIKRNRGSVLNYVNSDVSQDVAVQGGSVTIPLYPTTTSTLLVDGSALASDDSVGSFQTVTLNRHRATKFSLTQMAQALSSPVAEQLIQGRIAGILNNIEEDVMSLATTAFTTNTVGTYNSAITEANAVLGVGNLLAQKVPADGLTAFVHPGAKSWQALVQIASFAQFQYTGQPSMVNDPNYANTGKFWHGANWIMSQAMPQSGTSTDNLIFHRNAICVAMRAFNPPMAPGVQAIPLMVDGVPLQMLVQWNGDRLADEVVIHALYGYSVGVETWGCLFKA